VTPLSKSYLLGTDTLRGLYGRVLQESVAVVGLPRRPLERHRRDIRASGYGTGGLPEGEPLRDSERYRGGGFSRRQLAEDFIALLSLREGVATGLYLRAVTLYAGLHLEDEGVLYHACPLELGGHVGERVALYYLDLRRPVVGRTVSRTCSRGVPEVCGPKSCSQNH
jgi:hypothetical protein